MTIPTIGELRGNTILQLFANGYNKLKDAIIGKQEKLVAGDNIVIDESTNRISAIVGGTPVLEDYYTKEETYNKVEIADLLLDKADTDDVYTKSQTYNKTEIDLDLADKADADDVYTKTEVDALIEDIPITDNVYTKDETYSKTEVNNLISPKANSSEVYTKVQTDNLLSAKANASTTYTKAETDNLLSSKANSNAVYSKSDMDTLLNAKANASSVYTKSEVDTKLLGKEDKKTWKVYTGSLDDFSILSDYGYIGTGNNAYAKFKSDTLIVIRDAGKTGSFEFKEGIEYLATPNPQGNLSSPIDRLQFDLIVGDIDSGTTQNTYLEFYRFSIGSTVSQGRYILPHGQNLTSSTYEKVTDLRNATNTKNYTIYVKEV